jgi:hypothetical protein
VDSGPLVAISKTCEMINIAKSQILPVRLT